VRALGILSRIGSLNERWGARTSSHVDPRVFASLGRRTVTARCLDRLDTVLS
jgi:hypothetical protein